MAGPPPASNEIFVDLDDGAQACIRILVLSLNAKGNNPHKVFDASILVGVEPGCRTSYLLTVEERRRQKNIPSYTPVSSLTPAKALERGCNSPLWTVEVPFSLLPH